MDEKMIVEKLEKLEKMMVVGMADVLDIDGASLLLGFAKSYIYKLTSQKILPHYKRGKSIFFEKKELYVWMTSEKVKTNDEIAADAERILLNRKK